MPILSIENLSYTYPGGHPSIHGPYLLFNTFEPLREAVSAILA